MAVESVSLSSVLVWLSGARQSALQTLQTLQIKGLGNAQSLLVFITIFLTPGYPLHNVGDEKLQHLHTILPLAAAQLTIPRTMILRP